MNRITRALAFSLLRVAAALAQVPLPSDVSGGPAAESELRDVVARFSLDLAALQRRYPVEASPERTSRALHKELVENGRMTDRAFHDSVITGGSMPVEMVRARVTQQPLAKDHKPAWKYAGTLGGR